MRVRVLTALSALVLVAGTAHAQGVTVQFQNFSYPTAGYRGVTDVRVADGYRFAWERDVNYADRYASRIGGDGGTWNRTSIALMRFDLSAVPTAGTLTDAGLVLYVSNPSSAPINGYLVDAPWSETQATWMARATGTPWQVPGAKGTADRGSQTLSFTATQKGTVTIPIPDLLVDSWITGSSNNYGFLLESPSMTDAFEFGSSRTGVLQRPMLVFVKNGVLYQLRNGVSGYTGTADTVIASADDPRTVSQNGSGLEINGWAGAPDPNRMRSSVLVRFDVQTIPSWAFITDVRLTFDSVWRISTVPVNAYPLNASWNQNATWHTRNGLVQWTDAGIGIGADTSAEPVATLQPADGGTRQTALFNLAGLALVGAWRDNPDANYGIVFQDHGISGTYFGADESEGTDGPRLAVSYFEGRLECASFTCPPDGGSPCDVDLEILGLGGRSPPDGLLVPAAAQPSAGGVSADGGSPGPIANFDLITGGSTRIAWNGPRAPFQLVVTSATQPQWSSTSCTLNPLTAATTDGGSDGGGGGSGGGSGAGGGSGSGGGGGSGGGNPGHLDLLVGCGCGATPQSGALLLAAISLLRARASRRRRATARLRAA